MKGLITSTGPLTLPLMEDMTVAILAGGLGTRLRKLVADRPKVLADVQGSPLLGHLLEYLAHTGIRHVVLCTGYMGDQVRASIGDSFCGIRITYSQESSPLGTAGALRLALPLFESESVFVLNGDSLCTAKLDDVLKEHSSIGADGTMVLTESDDTSRFGKVEVDGDGFIISFEEKGSSTGHGWINAGTYLLNRSLIESIPTSGNYSLERDMFPVWIKQKLHGYKFTGKFLDIGTPESYALASKFVEGFGS